MLDGSNRVRNRHSIALHVASSEHQIAIITFVQVCGDLPSKLDSQVGPDLANPAAERLSGPMT